jgi:hypothetical protein
MTNKKLLDPVMRKLVARGLRRAYPTGPDPERDELVRARLMVEDIVEEVSAVLRITGAPIALTVETQRQRNQVAVVMALVVYIPNAAGDGGRTITVPMTVSRNVAHVAGVPVFLTQINGATDLMAAVLDAVEKVMADAIVKCDGNAGSFAYQDYEDEKF